MLQLLVLVVSLLLVLLVVICNNISTMAMHCCTLSFALHVSTKLDQTSMQYVLLLLFHIHSQSSGYCVFVIVTFVGGDNENYDFTAKSDPNVGCATGICTNSLLVAPAVVSQIFGIS